MKNEIIKFNDNSILKEISDKHINSFLKDKEFHQSDNSLFIEYLCNCINKDLKDKCGGNFKYIIHISLIKDTSLDVSFNVSGNVNNETDAVFNKIYSFEKIGCILSIFVLAL